ncbi:S-layer homology domain-containing protein [Fusibacter sp. 3D3]|uniref:S-layer homology domain-containing protein n=1 Tax=Fusibacter sp. 3D3 TaxID=1048380 RepID=UPI000852D557|nr:S-layer homology domain-containing protein [Fusibacter sp. 3D3]GAU77756.1 proline-rich protein [Fusibacter sp. 3D3]
MNFKKLALIGILSITILSQTAFATATPTDIQGHWSEPFVTSLVSQGVISGYPDGTFKPDKSISNVEFLSLTLKAMNETVQGASSSESWDVPIMKRAYELGLVKTGEPMADATNEITREQSATVLYRALQIKEGIQYDQCYTPILDQVIFDHDQINSLYRDSVYSMLQKGVFTVSQSYFNPKGLLNRGATCVVIERVMDKSKRLDPVMDLMENPNITTIKVSHVEPKESTTTKTVPFENGKPIIDEKLVYNELKQHPNNASTGRLADYYDYEGYINSEWESPFYKTYEKKKEAVDEYYDTAVNGLKVLYNFSYDDITTYEKDLKYYEVDDHSTEDWINRRLQWITDNTLVMESYFVTDKSLFYRSSDGTNRTRGRLYFVYHFPSQEASMSDIDLKVDQWYYVDFEVKTSQYLGQFGVEWDHARITLGGKIYLSDVIPLKPLN